MITPLAVGQRRRPQPPVSPPALVKVAVLYAKRGPMRFTSPRVIHKIFKQAVRRAGLPVAFSSGFSPHPRLSHLLPAPTGMLSQAEYLLIRLTSRLTADQVAAALGPAMPDNLPIIKVVRWPDHYSLANRLEASLWQAELAGVSASQLETAAADLLSLSTAQITRPARGDKPAIQRDVRPAVVCLTVVPAQPGDICATIEMVLRQYTPAVRPDDVVAALLEVAGLTVDTPARYTRLAQGLLEGQAGSVSDPLHDPRLELPQHIELNAGQRARD